FYIKSLFFAIPTFVVFIFFEAIAARLIEVEINRSADVISSQPLGVKYEKTIHLFSDTFFCPQVSTLSG
ncbi:MAG TPA: hypothetical protein QGG35_02745, partial [Candidatus Marinimicrobia bacterium]|nr:hypothetical protein [Candidatus Neomarinimicrobiota bacterium]